MTTAPSARAVVALSLLLAACSAVEPESRLGRLALSHASRQVMVSQRIVVRVTAYDLNERVIPAPAVYWSSSDPSIASVDQLGIVTGHRPGMARITVAAGEITAGIGIDVEPGTLRLVMESGSYVLTPGQVDTAAAQWVTPEGFAVPVDRPVVWSTPDPHLIAIRPLSSETGHQVEVTVLADGLARISAMFRGLAGTMVLAVPTESDATSPLQNVGLTFVAYLNYAPSLYFSVRPGRRVDLVRLDLVIPGMAPAFQPVCSASQLLPGRHNVIGTDTWPGGHARHLADPNVVGVGILSYREQGLLRSVAFQGTMTMWDYDFVPVSDVPWEECRL